MKVLRLMSLVLLVSMLLVGCFDPQYNFIFGDDVEIEEGSKLTDGSDPFSEKGLYEDPEVEIDGIREPEYDYPTGSGRHLVYESETETTYVSIYKGERGIYFLFECEDDSLSALNVEDINLVTAQSDSVELYVDTYGVGGSKRGNNQHEFRVTCSERIYSYLTGFVARVFTYGTLNDHSDVDEGFNVEGYISYSVLGEGVDKNTPTSFAFARVTKTGNKGYVWHGNVDPQVPDNYLVLNNDNKFYSLDSCPASGVVSGKLLDISGNPVSGAKVSADGYKTVYTGSDGSYSLDITNCTSDLQISFSKKDYLENSVNVSKSTLRTSGGALDIGSSLFLKENESEYSTTLKGTLTERDGKTPISNALVEVNGVSTRTDKDGNYTLEANLSGYNGKVNFSADGHISYTKQIEIVDVAVNGTTDLAITNLDESAGGTIDFGKNNSATARIVRGEDSFKIVLKTPYVMDISQVPGSNFELFIDTKGSCAMNKRDLTDYLFVLQYADDGVLSSTRYGGGTVNTRDIKTSYGRINELYYVEAEIPYSLIGIEKDEVFGVYLGIKYNYDWTGMYDASGDYIQAEATINYTRVDANSNIFTASCNTEPATDLTFKEIGVIGSYSQNPNTVKYNVSYAREDDYIMLKLKVVDNGISMTDQRHSINVYFDMNCSDSKTQRDSSSYHMTIYPGRPVSVYEGWDSSTNNYSKHKNYEIDAQGMWTYLWDDTIYIKLDTAIFGGDASQSIGFGIGMWHDCIGANSILSMNGKTCSFENPSKYFIVDSNGNISIQ